MHKPRFGLLIVAGVGNLGNDASLRAMLDTIERNCPNSEVVCICPQPAQVSDRFNVPALPWKFRKPDNLLYRIASRLSFRTLDKVSDWVGVCRHVLRIDALIVPGTGALDDFGEEPQGLPYRLWLWCLMARLVGAKVAFVSVGAGPIVNPRSRRLMLGALRLAHYRTYRDGYSLHFARQWKIADSEQNVFPDLVFGLRRIARTPVRPQQRKGCVAIGVMKYTGWENRAGTGDATYARYVSELSRVISLLQKDQLDLRLLVGTQDLETIGDFKVSIASHGGCVERIDICIAATLEDHAAHMMDMDVVVATRYHTLIAALASSLPAIALGYAEKFNAVMQEYGLEPFCFDVETFEASRLHGAVTGLLARTEGDLTNSLRDTSRRLYDRLREQEELLAKSIFRPSSAQA